MIILNSVDLPAPFGPITPTMPPGGSLKLRFSIRSWSPKPFDRSSASITVPPRRGPGGMTISATPATFSLLAASISSYFWIRALLLVWRARADWPIHSFSADSARIRAVSSFSSCASRLRFWSSQEV